MNKVGPAAPPIKTEKGWLVLYHAVDIDPQRGKNGWEPFWKKRYCAGVMLLDLDDPSKVLGISKTPLLAPETRWETEEGFRTMRFSPAACFWKRMVRCASIMALLTPQYALPQPR